MLRKIVSRHHSSRTRLILQKLLDQKVARECITAHPESIYSYVTQLTVEVVDRRRKEGLLGWIAPDHPDSVREAT